MKPTEVKFIVELYDKLMPAAIFPKYSEARAWAAKNLPRSSFFIVRQERTVMFKSVHFEKRRKA